jgi:nucleotide-binding universal stress UspA family protein
MPHASLMSTVHSTRETVGSAAGLSTPFPGGSWVVVGYDGTDPARAALAYAARRAGRDGKVIVVYAAGSPEAGGGRGGDHAPTKDVLRGYILDTLLTHAGDVLHGTDFELAIVAGRPAQALARIASERQADEIAVGGPGTGSAQAPAHSVSRELLRTADRPVTVIPDVVPFAVTET